MIKLEYNCDNCGKCEPYMPSKHGGIIICSRCGHEEKMPIPKSILSKKLIDYIGEMEQVNYANVLDFLRDIQFNSSERQVELLVNVLLYIEQQENI